MLALRGLIRRIAGREPPRKRGLSDGRESLSALINSMTDALIIFDRDLNYVDLNEEAAKQMGVARGQIIGRNVIELSPTAKPSGRCDKYQEVLRSGVPCRLEFLIFHAGLRREISVDVAAFPISKELLGLRYYDISERVTAQKVLQESERRLRESQRIARIGSWERNLETNEVIWSDEIYRILGVKPDEVEPSHEWFLERVHPDDRALLLGETRRLFEEHGSLSVRFRMILPDGSIRVMSTEAELRLDESGKPVSIAGTMQDVTERVRSEEALRKSEEILRLFMESATDSFAILDQNLNFVDVNRATARLYGIRKEDFVGKNIAELTPETKTSGRYEQYLRVIRTGEPFHTEATISPPGAEREKRLSGTAFRVGAGLGLVAQDVTEQRHAEELLRSAKEEAELANRTKSEFLANMTHELRTPLNAIIGFSQVLERGIGGAVTDKQREYLKDIERSGDHLLDVISDILDLSKFELRPKEILDEQVDLAETISGSLRLVRDRLDTAGLTLQAQELKAVPLLRGDKRRLKQVLLNLLSNAIKFTNRGGSVTISGKTAEDGSVCLEVTDSGIGMTPSDIEKSLTPFGQVDSGLARNYEGTGLGLPISKSIMEAHGGKLEIESEPGEGTTVRLIFPAHRIIRGMLQAG